jgi:hypothetical protein
MPIDFIFNNLIYLKRFVKMTTPIRELLLKIWEDNDYVLTFQTTQETRDIASELKRLWDVKPEITITSSGPAGIILEPLLGYLTAFIVDLDKDIEKDKLEDDEAHQCYLEDIKSAAVKSRDRVLDWQLETIKNI